jgi:hypothetical protein
MLSAVNLEMEVHFRKCKHPLRQRIEIDYHAIARFSLILRRYRQHDRNSAVHVNCICSWYLERPPMSLFRRCRWMSGRNADFAKKPLLTIRNSIRILAPKAPHA